MHPVVALLVSCLAKAFPQGDEPLILERRQDTPGGRAEEEEEEKPDPCPGICVFSEPSAQCYSYDVTTCRALTMRWCPTWNHTVCPNEVVETPCQCEYDGPPRPRCGDGHCQRGETCGRCPKDCGFVDAKTDWVDCEARTGCPGLAPWEKAVHLSFNEGPSAYTERLLDLLKEIGVSASFWLVGENLRRFLPTAKRIPAEGHSVQTMTFTYLDHTRMDYDSILAEMALMDFELEETFGFKPAYMRPPYDSMNTFTFQAMKQLSYGVRMWNLNPNDTFYKSDNALILSKTRRELLLGNGHENFIYLGHDTTKGTVDIIPDLVNMFRDMGYRIVSLEECMFGNTGEGARQALKSSRVIPFHTIKRIVSYEKDPRIALGGATGLKRNPVMLWTMWLLWTLVA